MVVVAGVEAPDDLHRVFTVGVCIERDDAQLAEGCAAARHLNRERHSLLAVCAPRRRGNGFDEIVADDDGRGSGSGDTHVLAFPGLRVPASLAVTLFGVGSSSSRSGRR